MWDLGWLKHLVDMVVGIFRHKKTKQMKELVDKIRRYIEVYPAQTGTFNIAWTKERLFNEGIITEDELNDGAEEALQILFEQRILDYSQGCYYLKGDAPPTVEDMLRFY